VRTAQGRDITGTLVSTIRTGIATTAAGTLGRSLSPSAPWWAKPYSGTVETPHQRTPALAAR
jgi:hypothetical protein